MPSTASTRNKFELQASGENSGTWGTKANTVFSMVDACLDGVEDITVSGGSTTLTNVDYTADQAKNRVLNVNGTGGGTIVIPNVEKNYLVLNRSNGNVIVSSGGGTTATIYPGEYEWVVSTGSNVVYATGGKVGYKGGGGTATQATSKATGVTINRLTGDITMNAAALAAGAVVSFVLTNDTIADSDMLLLTHRNGGTIGGYSFEATCSGGLATIYVRNNTAGSLAEAVVIRFAVFKAATA